MAGGKSNREVMRGIYEGYSRGDLAPFFAVMAEDGRFGFAARRQDIDFAGVWTGHKNIGTSLDKLAKRFKWEKFSCRELIADGDRVVALTGGEVRCLVSNNLIPFEMVDVIRFRDGKIVEFVEYFDSALLRDVIGAAAKLKSARPKLAHKKKKPAPKRAAKPARRKARSRKTS
jgi:ketosteroid isomerase-like protein